MNWKLEVGDVACPVDDMKTTVVFTFLRSEREGWELGVGEQGYRLMGESRMQTAQGYVWHEVG
jgi:hypothetical protein